MESSVVTDRNQVPYSAQFPNENMRKDCSTRIYTKGKNTCTNLHKIQFHCRSQLRLQQRLNSEERKCTCKQPLALHNPKALHMTPATSQDPTGTAHSEGGRLQRSQFSLDTTKKKNPSPEERYNTAKTIMETFNTDGLQYQARLLQTHPSKSASY